MAGDRKASCSCGALSVGLRGEPVTVAMCSCEECQRRTGSAFGYSGYWEETAATIAGASKAWSRVSAVGRTLEFHFCPVCGSTVWWRAEFLAGKIGIALGNVDDGVGLTPSVAVWDKRRHPWLVSLSELKTYPEGRF